MSLGSIIQSMGGFPGIFLGASLLDMFLKNRGGKGKGLESLYSPEQLRTGERDPKYKGDPGKYKPFINTLTDERFATEEERDKDVAKVQALMADTQTAAQGGLMSVFNLGGMASTAPRFGGLLQGPGTGTSDSIPGMSYQGGVPVQQAALSDGEFVFTNKAVKAAGGGSIDKGAKVMYELMNNLERRS